MVEQALFVCDGHRGTDRYFLMFTSERLMVIHVLGGIARIVMPISTEHFVERRRIKMLSREAISRLEELIRTSEKSYVVPYRDVALIELKRGRKIFFGGTTDVLTLHRTTGGSEKFRVDVSRKRLREFIGMLKPFLREKLVIR